MSLKFKHITLDGLLLCESVQTDEMLGAETMVDNICFSERQMFKLCLTSV